MKVKVLNKSMVQPYSGNDLAETPVMGAQMDQLDTTERKVNPRQIADKNSRFQFIRDSRKQ